MAQRDSNLATHTDDLSGAYKTLGDILADRRVTEDEIEQLLRVYQTLGRVLRGLMQVIACWEVAVQWLKIGGPNKHATRKYEAAYRVPAVARVPVQGVIRASAVRATEAQEREAA